MSRMPAMTPRRHVLDPERRQREYRAMLADCPANPSAGTLTLSQDWGLVS